MWFWMRVSFGSHSRNASASVISMNNVAVSSPSSGIRSL